MEGVGQCGGLLGMPVELLYLVRQDLNLADWVALVGTCRFLRTVFGGEDFRFARLCLESFHRNKHTPHMVEGGTDAGLFRNGLSVDVVQVGHMYVRQIIPRAFKKARPLLSSPPLALLSRSLSLPPRLCRILLHYQKHYKLMLGSSRYRHLAEALSYPHNQARGGYLLDLQLLRLYITHSCCRMFMRSRTTQPWRQITYQGQIMHQKQRMWS